MNYKTTSTTFKPPWWMKNPHMQTILPTVIPQKLAAHSATLHRVDLADGDAIAIHEDCPKEWRAGGKVAILSHGLTDHHRTPLLVRLTEKLTARGVRVFRWDMRSCGAGIEWARHPYHAGCSDDLATVVHAVIKKCCKSEASIQPDITLFGVSLSGNVLLKYLGESPDRVPAMIGRAIAVNPPIDLIAGIESISKRRNRVYDRHFTRMLLKHHDQWSRVRPDVYSPVDGPRPRTLEGFDNWFTAPAIGYRDAREYYIKSSSAQFIPSIRIPTTIITARDDPFVPFEMFSNDSLRYPDNVELVPTDHGGHVGFVGKKGNDPDMRWLDWRIVEIVTGEVIS